MHGKVTFLGILKTNNYNQGLRTATTETQSARRTHRVLFSHKGYREPFSNCIGLDNNSNSILL